MHSVSGRVCVFRAHPCVSACVRMCLRYNPWPYENTPHVYFRATFAIPSLFRPETVPSSNSHPRQCFLESGRRQTLLWAPNPASLELGRRHLNWQQNAPKFPQAGLGLEQKVLCAASWLLPPRRPWASSASFWQEVPGTWVGGPRRPVQGQRKGCSFQDREPLCSGLPKGVAVK